MVEAARDAVALMGTSIRHTPISRRIMQASQRLRVVAKYTVGVDDIDTEAATDLGVMVCHAPTESNCFGVAETTVTFMLALFKKLRERDADVRAGKWRELRRISPTTSAAAPRTDFPARPSGSSASAASARGWRNCWRPGARASSPTTPTCRRRISSPTASQAVDYETLLRQSDVVSFHVVLTRETRYMFGEEQLKLMKPNAIVLNTARGKVIDEKALAARSRKAACAAPRSTPSRRSRCRWTRPCASSATGCCSRPHSASFTEGGELRQGVDWATRSVVTALKGGIPDNVYNRDVHPALEGALWRRQRRPADSQPYGHLVSVAPDRVSSRPAARRRNLIIFVKETMT